MKINYALRFGLALSIAGCVAPSQTTTSAFLQTPSPVRFQQPLAVQVVEVQTDLAKPLSRPSHFYRTTADTDQNGRLAELFAGDLQRILEMKTMASQVCILGGMEGAPPDFSLLRIRLRSWFGRVPDPPATARAATWLLGNRVAYAEGGCEFDAELWQNEKLSSLGRHRATVRIPTKRSPTLEEHGRLASARAADQAIAALISTLEKFLEPTAAAPAVKK